MRPFCTSAAVGGRRSTPMQLGPHPNAPQSPALPDRSRGGEKLHAANLPCLARRHRRHSVCATESRLPVAVERRERTPIAVDASIPATVPRLAKFPMHNLPLEVAGRGRVDRVDLRGSRKAIAPPG
jgi:hypothetical protein